MRMTPTGQISIPENIRKTLGITANSELEFKQDKGRFYIVKREDGRKKGKFSKLRGIATTKLSSTDIIALTREP